MLEEDVLRLDRTEMRMVRWMCGVSLENRKSSLELRETLGRDNLRVALRMNRQRWFGHFEKMDDNSWVKKCTHLNVAGKRDRGKPRFTWDSVVSKDMELLGLSRADAQDCVAWRPNIWGKK